MPASEDEAAAEARSIGFPVVLKLNSTTITHKTDVGGVELNLADEAAVRGAWRRIAQSVAERAGPEHFAGVTVQPMVRQTGYELIVGSMVDEQFGPVLLFGAGGQLVEVIHDRALALPPLNATLALRMMQQTKIFRALEGVRGRKPVDVAGLEQLLVRFSQLVVEQRWIREIDINPLLAGEDGLIALDARVVLHPPDMKEEDLPRLAIRPYPTQYVTTLELADHTTAVVRPIRPEDEPLLVKFHEKLSDDTVYNRYSQMLKLSQRVAHERLSRICFIDYEREMTLIVERKTAGEAEIIGVVRLIRIPGTGNTELSLVDQRSVSASGIGNPARAMCGRRCPCREDGAARRIYVAGESRHAACVREAWFPHHARQRPGDRAFGPVGPARWAIMRMERFEIQSSAGTTRRAAEIRAEHSRFGIGRRA